MIRWLFILCFCLILAHSVGEEGGRWGERWRKGKEEEREGEAGREERRRKGKGEIGGGERRRKRKGGEKRG